VILPYEIFEALRAPLAGKDEVAHRFGRGGGVGEKRRGRFN